MCSDEERVEKDISHASCESAGCDRRARATDGSFPPPLLRWKQTIMGFAKGSVIFVMRTL